MNNDTIKVLLVTGGQKYFPLIETLLSRAQGQKFEVQWIKNLDSIDSIIADSACNVCLFDDLLIDNDDVIASQILAAHTNIPFILLTTQENDENLVPEGFVDYIAKNQLSTEILERSIRYAIYRKKIESTLHQTSAKYNFLSTAIENLSVGVIITDPNQPDNPLIYINPAFTAISGYTPEEALGRNTRFLNHPDADPQMHKGIHDAIKERRLFKGVLRNRRKDGTSYQNSLVISPVFDAQGNLTNYVGLSEDVTAQYEAQEALQHSEERFAGMVANVPCVIYRALFHPNGSVEILFINEGCRSLLGIAPEQFLSGEITLQRMVHPHDLPSYEEAIRDANQQQPPQPWQWLGRFVLPSGEEKFVQCQSHPIPQENGDIIWDGCVTDVTEHLKIEQRVLELAAIVENSTDAIIGKTPDGIITSWNNAAEHIYGYTAAEMIGSPISRLLPPDRPNEVNELLQRIARGEHVQRYETVRQTKDNKLLNVDLTVSPIKDNNGHIIGASAIAQDITRRKKAEEQNDRQMQRIQALRNIDMAITGSLDLRVTLNIILDQVTTHLNVDSAAILLLNPHTQRLEYSAGRGFRTTALQHTGLRLGEGYAGRAALERRTVTIPDFLSEKSDFMRNSLLAGEGFVAYCAAPLITKMRVEGVLEIFHRAPLPTDSDWLAFLETLAGQAAIALENADLFVGLQRSNVELQLAYDTTLEGWSKALDLRDEETEGHTLRVTEATIALATAMNISGDALLQIRRGALLHDIGKMGIPDSILLKPDELTEEEELIMKKHPVYAYELLSPIQFLRPALDIPYCHHEKWDGSGYPRGLKHEQIPISARIFAVVDVWDALRSDRPYRPGWPAEKIREHIAKGSGTHFDPQVVETFLNMTAQHFEEPNKHSS